jgi:hypothetical protein
MTDRAEACYSSETEHKVDYVISLGGNCRVTWNVRRFFNFSTAFPFDWWITPWRALDELLTDFNVDRLYCPDLLEEVKANDGAIASIRHRELGIILQHEFPRDWSSPSNPVRVGWSECLAKPKQRTRYLLKRLVSTGTARKKILFVRNTLHRAIDRTNTFAPGATADRLRALFPSADIHLLFINCPIEVNEPGISHLNFDDAAEDWRGDWDVWRRALKSTGFRLENSTLRAFHEGGEPESQIEKSLL